MLVAGRALKIRSLIASKGPTFRRCYITSRSKPPVAFAFDIDGVLLQGSSILPAAKRALEILEGKNESGLKIPYILITNGGGYSEEDRSRRLSSQLDVEIGTSQLVQAHTVLRQMAKERPDEPVLVLGGAKDRVRKVAEGYGFRNVYIPSDILAWNPKIWPFHTLSSEEHSYVKKVDFSNTPISSILVFHDPRNWSLDIQIMVDVLRSRTGCPGAPYRSEVNNNIHEEKRVALVFCNPDLLWRSEFERPRLGQGTFIEAFQAVYKSLTGTYYPFTQYGKPHEATYKYAETMLIERLASLEGRRVQEVDLPNVYMVGDNPASGKYSNPDIHMLLSLIRVYTFGHPDIAGANAAKWLSVLVHTGVYDPALGPPAHKPTYEAADVEEAVRWALGRENVHI